MDQASAHRAHEIDWPENIIPLFQPAYTPEVNPIERFWKHLKTPLQWETFKNLKSLRQRVNTVLSEMTTDVIRSVTGWEFITECCIKRILKLNWYYLRLNPRHRVQRSSKLNCHWLGMIRE